MYAFVARRTRDRAEAEDVTATVFHHALANLGRFEWRGVPFAAWLQRIARNTIADRGQRSARERPEVVTDAVDDGALGKIDQRAILADLVGRLPADQQRVIVERFVAQKTVREIAHELGRTEGAVKQLQYRALEALRTRLRDVHE